MNKIIAEEEVIIESEFPEWQITSDKEKILYLIDFEKTKRLVFKMGNGKKYYFSLVRIEDEIL